MKKINFTKYGQGIDKILIPFMLLFVGMSLIQLFMDYEHELFKASMFLSHILILIVLFRWTFKPNSVWWNKRGLSFNLNSKFPKTIQFDDIREVVNENQTLIIKRVYSSTLKIPVSSYKSEDVDRLKTILLDKDLR